MLLPGAIAITSFKDLANWTLASYASLMASRASDIVRHNELCGYNAS